jgi:4-alpha-glucanotransferase
VSGRHAGVNVPLFSIRSSASWGIGELADVAPFSDWMASAGFDRLLVLPLGALARRETSPYAPASTMAIDPRYIALSRVRDFERAGGIDALSPEAREALDAARRAPAVRHDAVRRAKGEALDRAFDAFLSEEWSRETPRAESLAAYVDRERWWLDDYALFQALTTAMAGAYWLEWPSPLRDRDPGALDEARRQWSAELLRHQYWQWLAETQWQEARVHAATRGVAIVGDLPFTAGADSADVWAHADEFALAISVGVPPDAFSPDGQDWGLPAYRWDVIERSGYAWMRQRARRMAALFDAMRVDHVVGLYRTYGLPPGGLPFFSPAEEPAQRRQGEAVLTILGEAGARLIAEDLGTVPDFVRASLAALGVPGCRVMRWERRWHEPGLPYLDPRDYPVVSAAMTGTHDTESLPEWWDTCGPDTRRALLELPFFVERALTNPDMPWTEPLRDAYLALAYGAASSELYLPLQDLFGWRGRVNTPGTVTPENWTWCVPWPVDTWDGQPDARERAGCLRALARAAGRHVAG